MEMAGKGSKARHKKGVKRRSKKASTPAQREEIETREEESGGGTLMGLRGGFKTVAGQGDRIMLLKRKTDWFKVRMPRGSFDTKEGWVHVSQLQHTLDLDGNPLVVPKTGMEAFASRRWEIGLGGGSIDGAATINGSLAFNLNPHLGVQGEAAQILGDYSDGYMGSISVFLRPFPRSRISPFFNIGTGYIHIQPQTTIVQAQDLNDEIVHAGLGADLYLSRKFMVRMEYRRHTVLTSRDDNEELNQWKAGFSIFF